MPSHFEPRPVESSDAAAPTSASARISPEVRRAFRRLRLTGAGVELETLLRPYVIVALAAAVSFAVWIAPWSAGVHRGYTTKEPLTAGGLGLLLAWYGMVALVAFASFRLGRRVRPVALLDREGDDRVYGWLVGVALVGVVFSYGSVLVRKPAVVLGALEHQTFNEIRHNLAYAAGVQTLRYAAIAAGGIALGRILSRRRIARLDAAALALLLAAAAIASRLSIVLAAFIALGLFVRARPGARLTPLGAVVIAAGFFLVTTPLSYVRTASFYETRYGTSNPFVINAYEFISYLSAPTQVAVGVANHLVSEGSRNARRYYDPGVSNPSFSRGLSGWILVLQASPQGTGRGRVATSADLDQFGLPVSVQPVRGRRAALVLRSDGGQATVVRIANRLRLGPAKLRDAVASVRARYAGSGRVRVRVEVLLFGADDAPIGRIAPSRRVTGFAFPPGASGSFVAGERPVLHGGRLAAGEPGGVAYGRMAINVYFPEGATGSLTLDDVRVGSIVTRDAPDAVATFLSPTYVPLGWPEEVNIAAQSYRNYVSVDPELTTNSVFASMVSAIGWAAFGVIALVAGLAAFVAGHASRYRSHVYIASLVVAYCFAELWRTYIFNAGVVHFLVIVLVGASVLAAAAERLRPLRRRG